MLRTLNQLDRVTLRNNAGLTFDLFPNGAVCAVRHESVLINQMIGVLPEGAPFRLWLRGPGGATSLVGPATATRFNGASDRHAVWQGERDGVVWQVALVLDEQETAWSWHIRIRNESDRTHAFDTLLAQDLGIAIEQGVRLNEAYTSHYIDHTVIAHDEWGPVICSRQNLQQAGRHPWIAHACPTGAVAFATDAMDVFGLEQRAHGNARAESGASLPSVRRQGESACAAVQSRSINLAPGEHGDFSYIARYCPDHPDVSSEKDLALLHAPEPPPSLHAKEAPPPSIWDAPALLHGDTPDTASWDRLYPERQHEEWRDGKLWSFFTKDGRHVVSRLKEEVQERSHGHILYASAALLPEPRALGATIYASGVFNAQVYHANPNTARLLTVLRDAFQRVRGAGQRIWIDDGKGWRLLGTPSLFEMDKHQVLWRYAWDNRTIEVRVRAQCDPSAITVDARVLDGPPVRWRFTHQLTLDANELDSNGQVDIDEENAAATLRPDPDTLAAQRNPEGRFHIRAEPREHIAAIGTDTLIWTDGKTRGAPYLVFETDQTSRVTLRIDAATEDYQSAQDTGPAAPAWRVAGKKEEVMALADILPWFRHDAWIHLASPHGLEQYGGAAWGVRDVCQGPVEWLITEQAYDPIRSILHTVFSHQYAEDGLWPQWFMLGPYEDLQQRHCHGDIMFWPLKALCDYAEAANDPGILDMEAPFTRLEPLGSKEGAAPLSHHVQRVIEAYRAQCIPGTSLVAYGDGDWDDTLQPVQPEMRRNMVSAWTVQLAFHVFGQLTTLYRRSNRDREAEELDELCARIQTDFVKHLMPDGIVAGFAVFRNGRAEPLLHPRDKTSGIQYRLLPMSRGIISGIFDKEQARTHRELIREHLRFPDGVRLMNRPVPYTGGSSHVFQRAETSAYFGREVSLQYVHAHLRYAEAMTRMGDADEAWWALQIVNPLGLHDRLPNALPRQANVYFSSSDGDFADRYDAHARYQELRTGAVGVKGGWRLYSSGPGLYLHKVRCGLLGIREYYDEIHLDPVLPSSADRLVVDMQHEGASVNIRFAQNSEPDVRINNRNIDWTGNTDDPYRTRGMILDRSAYRRQLTEQRNTVDIHGPSIPP